ncbi:TetR/AcrR family transcriptional regulator [Solicola gregarius]|uniref:TetR/AcrR family transcriptional regulator n=1 Tax=Solicola gregarius TaxID=2908642 RepID=A0AA46TJ03_9ACTN|nr:TetR/AcrR family transcriptional regulator [Solicola gregarius]UYM06003.1 TetR/AcrR family transcriptional regulator [Solicola gregarius]
MPTPNRTSLAEIVSVGRDLLEEGGPTSLTMQRVAERVGVRAPSLYKRVRDRDALLRAVAAATAGDLTERLAASDGTLDSVVRAYRAFAHERPEGFRLLLTPLAPGEALDRAAAPVLSATRRLVGTDALEAARLVTAWMTGFIQMELTGAFRMGGDVDRAFEYGLERLRAGLESP